MALPFLETNHAERRNEENENGRDYIRREEKRREEKRREDEITVFSRHFAKIAAAAGMFAVMLALVSCNNSSSSDSGGGSVSGGANVVTRWVSDDPISFVDTTVTLTFFADKTFTLTGPLLGLFENRYNWGTYTGDTRQNTSATNTVTLTSTEEFTWGAGTAEIIGNTLKLTTTDYKSIAESVAVTYTFSKR